MSDPRAAPLLRVVDYVANPGGGVRFAAETLRGLLRARPLRVELVSHGEPLRRYGQLLADAPVRLLDVPPANAGALRPHPAFLFPFAARLARRLGMGAPFHHEVPPAATAGADLVWLPWGHRHRFRHPVAAPLLVSLHDLILIEFRRHFPAHIARSETETVRRWLESAARVVVSSEATAAGLQRLPGAGRGRVDVVPLSGAHAERAPGPCGPPPFPFAQAPFLLCPANISGHKNHEVLIDGFALAPRRHPLVLTGVGTELGSGLVGRRAALRRRARARGLVVGRDLHGLGYVDDATYFALLARARALVMPTLAEGGGSFPVWEALFQGVPAVCSDIPVMREMMGRVGGDVLWFDPRRAGSLAEALERLDADYEQVRRRAQQQVATLSRRGWDDVGRDYLALVETELDRATEARRAAR